MADIATAQAGDWNTASTWSGGVVPTASDRAFIHHTVTVAADFTASSVLIFGGGELIVDETAYAYGTQITCNVRTWELERQLNDHRRVHLPGVLFTNNLPGFYSLIVADGLPYVGYVTAGDNVIIDDPGYMGASATLQDIKPEGMAHAYARKVGNGVRYLTVTVHIKSSAPMYLGALLRMASNPFQIILATNREVIKGHIETVVPDQSAVGTEYITVKVTVAEGA